MSRIQPAAPAEFDWRDSGYYRRLHDADRRHWAWFWFRRSPSWPADSAAICDALECCDVNGISCLVSPIEFTGRFRSGYFRIRTTWAIVRMLGSFGCQGANPRC